MQPFFLRIQPICFLYIFFLQFGHPYNLECPKAVQWKLRAKGFCTTNDTDKYFCLYDVLDKEYTEGCRGPDWDRKGCKRIISGDFTRGICTSYRYQPFDFWSNGSSECVYSKNMCAEKGQIISSPGSGYLDRTCRCDFARGYNYTQPPADLCNCKPSVEDCSCFRKECCDWHDFKALDLKCSNATVIDSKDDQGFLTKSGSTIRNNLQAPTFRRDGIIGISVSVCVTLALILYIMLILLAEPLCSSKTIGYQFLTRKFYASMQEKSRTTDSIEGKRLYLLDENKSDNSENTDNTDKSSVESKQAHDETLIEDGEIYSDEEINYLRIVHLIFGVACPVVRMVFNDEINPKKLGRTVDQNSLLLSQKLMKVVDRIHRTNINNNSSDSFDIKFMINLLKELKIICIGDQLPLRSDTRKDALLSRIQFYRSAIVDAVDGRLSDEEFQNYWKEIGQTILRLASKHLDEISRNTTLKELLLSLCPIKEEDIRLQHYVMLTERFPQLILQQLIREYSIDTYGDETMISFLQNEKHNLLHKRKKQSYCCNCCVKTFSYIIPDTLWHKLYMYKEKKLSHSCKHKQKCVMRYDINFNFELRKEYSSVLILLVLNTPRLLNYIVKQMYTKSISPFLERCKHSIYHAVDTYGNVKCCRCKDRTAVQMQTMFTHDDWNKLFTDKNTAVCTSTIEHCCCLFSVEDNINIDILDDTLLFKIMSVAGPFHVLDKCYKNTLNHFLCWDGETKEYVDACGELLGAVKDVEFKQNLESKFSLSCPTAEEFDHGYLGEWIIRNASEEKTTTGSKPDLVFLLQDRGKLSTQHVSDPNNARVCLSRNTIISWTLEEANFIKLNYLLNQVVCPVVRTTFDIHIPGGNLQHIITDIYYRDLKLQESQPTVKNKSYDKELLRLTSVQRNRMFLTKQDSAVIKSDVLDLSLMIRILKEKRNAIETLKNDEGLFSHLEHIKWIRGMITKSPSGLLKNEKFEENWNILSNVVVSLTGNVEYMRRLNDLKTRDILKDVD